MKIKAQKYDTAKESVEMRLFRINRTLERLSRHYTKEERNLDTKEIHWGHDGDLGQMESLLNNISNITFKEGEHAPENVA